MVVEAPKIVRFVTVQDIYRSFKGITGHGVANIWEVPISSKTEKSLDFGDSSLWAAGPNMKMGRFR